MLNIDTVYENSQIGKLLVDKGIISEQQLTSALESKSVSGRKLGEELIERNIITERQLKKVLRRQSRHRFIFTIIAALAGAQPSFSLANIEKSTSAATEVQLSETHYQHIGMQPLGEDDLRAVSGQGLAETAGLSSEQLDILDRLNIDNASVISVEQLEQLNGLGNFNSAEGIRQFLNTASPLSQLFDADITVEGISYDDGDTSPYAINDDGSIELNLPSNINRIEFQNLRVKGASDNQTFGDLIIKDLSLRNSSIRISVR